MELLRLGSSGPDVELLQTALRRAGYYRGALDGLFGPQTWQAVVNFQVANGLIVDGIVGFATWSALNPYLTGYITWQIRPGDTLFRLALQNRTTVQAIMTANPGITAANLRIGNTITIPLGFEVVPTDISFTFRLLSLCVEGLTARYPFIQTKIIGHSVAGRALYSLDIGSGNNHVMYNASHHANEWITTPVLMHFLEEYAASYSNSGSIFGYEARQIYERSTIHLVPMVNPDGVDLVTGAIPPGSALYRMAQDMNYLNLPFPDGWKANIKGVDLNLNYPAGWEIAREIKFAQGFTAPGPRDYVGPEPLSEPESRAMVMLSRTYDFRLTLSYHTQGEVIFWRYLDYLPPDSLEIVRLFSEVSGYTYLETPYASGHAGYKDWFIQEFNRPGYTIEAGLGANPLPITQFDKIYNDNIGILTLGALV